MDEEYIKIPLKIIKGNDSFKNRKNIRFIVKSKYNYLTEDYKLLSDIWFSKAESYFKNGYSIVKKTDFQTNILDENGNFMLDEWYYDIERIYYSKNLFLITKQIKETKEVKFRIFSIEKGFLFGEEWHDDFKNITNNYFYFCDFLNGKTNKLVYSFKTGLLSSESFENVKFLFFDESFLVSKKINNKISYNILKTDGNFALNNWSLIEPIIKQNYYIYNTIKDEHLYFISNENGDVVNSFLLNKEIIDISDLFKIINKKYNNGMF